MINVFLTMRNKEKMMVEEFDFGQIPSNVQYDVITLPSKGECYPHKIGKVPVAYLTASDENIIASPNLYKDGKVIDVILSRKILDKRIDPMDLTKGDRDAIVLWLRATGYGTDFPITAKSPVSGENIDTTVDLSELDYKPFDLHGDENGLFSYNCENGDVIKFKYVTKRDEIRFIESKKYSNAFIDKQNMSNAIREIGVTLANGNIDSEHSDLIMQYMEDVAKIVDDIDTNETEGDETEDNILTIFTDSMKLYTVSVNGNSDDDYVQSYVENMRVKEAKRYREYVTQNMPGVDLEVEVKIPESDGGGSFKTFLTVDESCFITL